MTSGSNCSGFDQRTLRVLWPTPSSSPYGSSNAPPSVKLNVMPFLVGLTVTTIRFSR